MSLALAFDAAVVVGAVLAELRFTLGVSRLCADEMVQRRPDRRRGRGLEPGKRGRDAAMALCPYTSERHGEAMVMALPRRALEGRRHRPGPGSRAGQW